MYWGYGTWCRLTASGGNDTEETNCWAGRQAGRAGSHSVVWHQESEGVLEDKTTPRSTIAGRFSGSSQTDMRRSPSAREIQEGQDAPSVSVLSCLQTSVKRKRSSRSQQEEGRSVDKRTEDMTMAPSVFFIPISTSSQSSEGSSFANHLQQRNRSRNVAVRLSPPHRIFSCNERWAPSPSGGNASDWCGSCDKIQ